MPLRRYLATQAVETAAEIGWSGLGNGELIAAADEAGFGLMITTDQNLRYQQNLSERRMGIVVLMTTSWPRIERRVQKVIVAINEFSPGGYHEVRFD